MGKGLSRTDTHLNGQSVVDVFSMGFLRAVDHLPTCSRPSFHMPVAPVGHSRGGNYS